MKQAVVTIKYDEEKLNAVKQYMGKKDADFEAELNEVLGVGIPVITVYFIRQPQLGVYYHFIGINYHVPHEV